MGELLDRAFQRELLEDLRNLYPQPADLKRTYGQQTDNRLLVNLAYLDEHGLIDFKSQSFMDGTIGLHSAKITARGMDFIADDGGLSAILGVVTIKLHEDTIKALLIQKVEATDGDATVKASLIAKIKAIPSEALGTLTQRALDEGLDHAPDLLGSLSKWLGL